MHELAGSQASPVATGVTCGASQRVALQPTTELHGCERPHIASGQLIWKASPTELVVVVRADRLLPQRFFCHPHALGNCTNQLRCSLRVAGDDVVLSPLSPWSTSFFAVWPL